MSDSTGDTAARVGRAVGVPAVDELGRAQRTTNRSELADKLGIDLIWFGVLYLICMQLGLLLPPHGLLLMTMKGVAPPQVTMAHIFQAVVPYIAMRILPPPALTMCG